MAKADIVIHLVAGEPTLVDWCETHQVPCYELPIRGLTDHGVSDLGSIRRCARCSGDDDE